MPASVTIYFHSSFSVSMMADDKKGDKQECEAGSKSEESLKMPSGRVWYFTDSSAMFTMLQTELGRFDEFVEEARVSEVKVNSERCWLTGDCNPADLGTRMAVKTEDHEEARDQEAAGHSSHGLPCHHC